MLRTVAFISVLLFSQIVVLAQPPCTTDARRIVDEIYRRMLERAPDPASGSSLVERLVSGSATVRDLVRVVAKSPEHTQRFFSPGRGRDANEQTVGTLYRHLLGRQPDSAGTRAYAELAMTNGVGAVIDDILASPEYRQSFGDNGVPGSGGLRYCGQERSQSAQAAGQANEMRFTTWTAITTA